MDKKNVKDWLRKGLVQEADFAGHNWIYQAISYGLLMFIVMDIILPLCSGDSLTFFRLIKQLFLWMVAGVFYALSMKLYFMYFVKNKTGG